MNFKEMLQRDLNEVIFNCNELAEPHRIALQGEEEREIPIIIDGSKLEEWKSSNQYLVDTVSATTLILIRKSDINPKPAQGSLFTLDGNIYRVLSVSENGIGDASVCEVVLGVGR